MDDMPQISAIMKEIIKPACAKAQGRVSREEPTIVFQIVKTVMRDDIFLDGL